MRNSVFVCATFLAVTALGAVAEPVFKLRLLHTNDMHARFEQVSESAGTCSENDAKRNRCYGGFARVQAALMREFERAQRENVAVLSLNAGDTYQGTVWYTVYKWKAVSHFLKMLKIDAMALGNHEFDDGIKGLTPFLMDVGIPVLAANINFTGEPEMLKTPIKNHLILERGGKKIGIIGYLTPETVVLADVGHLKFKNEIDTLIEESRKLKQMGVDILIALGHSGYEEDLEIATKVPDIDVVVGGHSHTFLYTGPQPDTDKPVDLYPVMVKQKSGRKVAMVQAYAFTKYLGILDLEFDDKGELLLAKGNPILLNEAIPEDPTVLREIKEWGSKLNATLKQNLANTSVLLDGDLCRFYECNLGNLITDAFIHYAVKTNKGPNWSKAAIAIQQGGGIRSSINTLERNGTITREDIIIAMPFFSSLSLVRIKGEYLFQALEWSVARYDPEQKWGRGEFLQMSGIIVQYFIKMPANEKVIFAKVRCQNCKVPRYYPLKRDMYYDVIMPTFLLKGGDNFSMFLEHGKEIEKFRKYKDKSTTKAIWHELDPITK